MATKTALLEATSFIWDYFYASPPHHADRVQVLRSTLMIWYQLGTRLHALYSSNQTIDTLCYLQFATHTLMWKLVQATCDDHPTFCYSNQQMHMSSSLCAYCRH